MSHHCYLWCLKSLVTHLTIIKILCKEDAVSIKWFELLHYGIIKWNWLAVSFGVMWLQAYVSERSKVPEYQATSGVHSGARRLAACLEIILHHSILQSLLGTGTRSGLQHRVFFALGARLTNVYFCIMQVTFTNKTAMQLLQTPSKTYHENAREPHEQAWQAPCSEFWFLKLAVSHAS